MKSVAVIGGGPAGLMAAERLAAAGFAVTVYDRMAGMGRKFLLAGRGGLNLTHSESLRRFLARYRPSAGPHLAEAIAAFPPEALRAWCEGLGETTFIGSSGRVFPRSFRASPLLRAWLARLAGAGVRFSPRHRWLGWDASGALVFATAADGQHTETHDATVLALGGASWPRLGSDGGWVDILRARGVTIADLQPANSGFIVAWSEHFRGRFEGAPLKKIALTLGNDTARGEAVVTAMGIEGGAVYALSAALRDAIAPQGEATLVIDLRPDLSLPELVARLALPHGKQSQANYLRKAAGLARVAIGLLREPDGRPPPVDPEALTRMIKAYPLRVTATSRGDRAISTAGGIVFSELTEDFMVRQLPGVFAAGEMLDWDAPTGGYLLQACFATGAAAAAGIIRLLAPPSSGL
ncbi:MAG: TIGR03862 family flavoprotein [Alphaproteobacteria bacterium]|nr:TIGR03862 family flavoprotein [Alphaproteobacteria bacterium]